MDQQESAAIVEIFISEFGRAAKEVLDLLNEHRRRTGQKEFLSTIFNTSITRELPTRLLAVLDQFVNQITPDLFLPRVIEAGDLLFSCGELKLAFGRCYSRFLAQLDLWPETEQDVARQQKGERSSRLALKVRAKFGSVLCKYHLLMNRDAKIRRQETLQTVKVLLDEMQQGMELALPEEGLYWLVYNGTVYIAKIAQVAITAGFSAHVTSHLLWAVACMEAVLPLCTVKYLAWKVNLYSLICRCYENVGNVEAAKSFSEASLAKLETIMALLASDEAPQSPASLAMQKRMARDIKIHIFKYTMLHEAESNPAAPCDVEGKVNSMFDNDEDRLQAIAFGLSSYDRRIVQHSRPAENRAKLVDNLIAAAVKIYGPHGDVIVRDYNARHAPPPPEGGEDDAQEEPPPEVTKAPPAKGGKKPPPKDEPPQSVGPPTMEMVATARMTVPMALHVELLKWMFNFESWENFTTVREGLEMRMEDEVTSDPLKPLYAEESYLLQAVEKLRNPPDTEEERSDTARTVCDIAEQLLKSILEHDELSQRRPDMVVDVAMILWEWVKPLLLKVNVDKLGDETKSNDIDEEAMEGLLRTVLMSIHTALSRVGIDDCLLKAKVALQLALVLEKQGACDVATVVLAQSVSDSDSWRAELVFRLVGSNDAKSHAIAARQSATCDLEFLGLPSASPEGDDLMPISEMDKALSCIQVDVLATLFRCEMEHGKRQAQLRADQKYEKSLSLTKEKLEKDLKQGFVVKKDALKSLNRDVIAYSRKTEQRLLEQCKENPYWKGILYMEMAKFRAEKSEQRSIIQLAMDEFNAAKEMEKGFLSASVASPHSLFRRRNPPAPLFVARASTAFVVKPLRFVPLDDDDVIHSYCLYGKPAGAGVSVSLNNIEYEGLGEILPAASAVFRTSGYDENDKFVFANAAFSDTGSCVGGIGQTSVPAVALSPLPLLLCWGYLSQAASSLGLYNLAVQCSQPVLDHFVLPVVESPLWEQNPMDRNVLSRERLRVASPAILRTLVRALVISADQKNAPSLFDTNDSDKLQKGIPLQVNQLVACSRLVMALQVASSIDNHELVMDCVLRVYDGVYELLEMNQKPKFVLQALVNCQKALSLVPAEIRKDHHEIRRVHACIIYEIISSYATFKLHSTAVEFADIKDLPEPISQEERALVQYLASSPRFVDSAIAANPESLAGAVTVWGEIHKQGITAASFEQLRKLKDSDNFVEMAVRFCESAMEKGNPGPVSGWVSQIQEDIRDKWKQPDRLVELEERANVREGGEVPEGATTARTADTKNTKSTKSKSAATPRGDEPPEGVSEEEWKKQNEAASFLQRNLLYLHERRKYRKALGEAAAKEGPWRSALELLRGLSLYELRVTGQTPLEGSGNAPAGADKADKKGATPKKGAAPPQQPPPVADDEDLVLPNRVQDIKGFRRAIVLSYRCKRWLHLQNCCRFMWNVSSIILEPAEIESGITEFVVAAECALQMLQEMKSELQLNSGMDATNEDENVIDPWFLFRLDLDTDWLAKFITFVIETLHTMEKYEYLGELGDWFNRLTDHRYAEPILPLMISGRTEVRDTLKKKERREKIRDENFTLAEPIAKLTAEIERNEKVLKDCLRDKSIALERLEETRAFANKLFAVINDEEGDTSLASERTFESGNTAQKATPTAVIASFQATIEVLRSRHETLLLVQTLNEFGDLYLRLNNVQLAGAMWSDAVDAIFNTLHVVKQWRHTMDQNSDDVGLGGGKVIESFGLRGLLLAAVCLGKIGRFVHTKDRHLQLECCLFAAKCITCCYSCSISNPQRLCDFATFELKELCPLVELFNNERMAKPDEVNWTMEYIASYLIDNGHPLASLPLLSLYQFTAVNYVNDVFGSLNARVLRVKALVRMGLLSQATHFLRQLETGVCLPGPMVYKLNPETLGVPAVSDEETEKCIWHNHEQCESEHNRQVVEWISGLELSEALGNFYGEYITSHMKLLRIEFLLRCGRDRLTSPSISKLKAERDGTPDSGPTPRSTGTEKTKGAKGGSAPAAAASDESMQTSLVDKANAIISELLTQHGGNGSGAPARPTSSASAKKGGDKKGAGKAVEKTPVSADTSEDQIMSFLDIQISSWCKFYMGVIHTIQGEVTKAVKVVQEATQLFQKETNRSREKAAEARAKKKDGSRMARTFNIAHDEVAPKKSEPPSQPPPEEEPISQEAFRTSVGDTFWLKAQCFVVEAYASQGRYEQCRSQCDIALQDATHLNDLATARRLLRTRIIVDIHRGEVDLVEMAYDQVIQQARTLFYEDECLALILADFGWFSSQIGRLDRAIEYLREAEVLLEKYLAEVGFVTNPNGVTDLTSLHLDYVVDLARIKAVRAAILLRYHNFETAGSLSHVAEVLLEQVCYPPPKLQADVLVTQAKAARHIPNCDVARLIPDLELALEVMVTYAGHDFNQVSDCLATLASFHYDVAANIREFIKNNEATPEQQGESNESDAKDPNEEAEKQAVEQTNLATYYLTKLAMVSVSKKKLENVLDLGATALADKSNVPTFAGLEIEEAAEYNAIHRIAGPQEGRASDAVAVIDSLSLMWLYHSLVREARLLCRFEDRGKAEGKVQQLHSYLRRSLTPYASLCLPGTSDKDPSFSLSANDTLVQWVVLPTTVDAGVSKGRPSSVSSSGSRGDVSARLRSRQLEADLPRPGALSPVVEMFLKIGEHPLSRRNISTTHLVQLHAKAQQVLFDLTESSAAASSTPAAAAPKGGKGGKGQPAVEATTLPISCREDCIDMFEGISTLINPDNVWKVEEPTEEELEPNPWSAMPVPVVQPNIGAFVSMLDMNTGVHSDLQEVTEWLKNIQHPAPPTENE